MEDLYILAIKPVKLTGIGYLGERGEQSPDWIMTNYALSKLVTQNILYSAYQQEKSSNEIAQLLGIPIHLVTEEIDTLETNGYMEKVDNDKYITNMLISDIPPRVYEQLICLYDEYAQKLYQSYIPPLLKHFSDVLLSHEQLYIPERDFSFFARTMIIYALRAKLTFHDVSETMAKYYTKRINGGDNIAITAVKNDKRPSPFQTEATIYFDSPAGNPITIWQYINYFEDKIKNFSSAFETDFIHLYSLIEDKNDSSGVHPEIIQRLASNGFIVNKEPSKRFINTIVTTLSGDDLAQLIPNAPKSLAAINDELSNKIYNLTKDYYPERMKELYQAFCSNPLSSCEMISSILNKLEKDGVVKPVNENRQNTIIFSDMLPRGKV